MEKKVILSAQHLAIGYTKGKQHTIVHENLNLELYQGELTCLLGPNGAGKSTLLRTLGTSQLPIAGEIMLHQQPIRTYSERKISREIGLVLTDRTKAGGLSVLEMVALGRHPHTGFFGRLSPLDKAIIERSLDLVGMADKRNKYVAELSDGERQKVMIAKALAQECPVVLLDEPTAFLDVVSRIEIMTLLHELAITEQKTILLSTHDLEQALLMADRLWLLSCENGLQCGNTEDLVLSGAMESLFHRDDIVFDKATGSYRPSSGYRQTIGVECSDDTLYFWTKNALTRNGYKCVRSSDDTACSHIRIAALHQMAVTINSETFAVNSFAELLDVIKDHHPISRK